MAVRLRHCCCGCSLKEGAIVIGVFFILLGVAAVAAAIFGIAHVALLYSDKINYKHAHPEVILPVSIVALVLAVIEVITCSLMLRGIVRYDRRLVLPWLIHNAALCGLLFLGVVGGAITCFIVTAVNIGGDLTTVTYGFIILVPGAVAVGVYVYFMMVVYSFYCLLPMLSSERIAVLLNRFKNPYVQQDNDSDYTTTDHWSNGTEHWSNATASPRFSGY